MKKLLFMTITLALAFTLSACCMFHHKRGPCDPGQNGPCVVEKPCCKKMQTPCPKPCTMEPGAQGTMPCSK